ncbi:hypothetical protein KC131_18600 [Pseudomonas sp. JQ170]|uniref:hypothetical protein n=1 Tax=unclassified Pseudomonas TaxID=196821 RepID=UPI002655BBEA|nr:MULTISPECIES: hypothetical protein [unclassified Pseudomonas]MDN7142662.1 hypothetical protein [Pseudomonas sp. JQ170]WRO77984.1 hypothetical protein U9R80_10045 [Pseudomonas sp. 170C]
MVSDKRTLSLLSRLADAQLALATSMRGISPSSEGYPEPALLRIAQAMEHIEAALVEISASTDAVHSPVVKSHLH